MFVQMFAGKVTDAGAVRAVLESWPTTAGRGAKGWLGSTGGITDEGQLIGLARFESEEAARANSERPEQDQWWQSLAANLEGEASFFESSEADEEIVADPDSARFVQVMRGRVSDPQRARDLGTDSTGAWAAFRPDVLGSLMLGHEDGEYVMAIYFTNEAEAREGEKKQPPPELAAQMQEMGALEVGAVTYYDLRDPILLSPK
ncbi:MAG: hypothetical protein WCG47_22035 [Dermatophilaceae bacterium]